MSKGKMTKMKLMELLGLPEHCIYALVSEKSKAFMVGYSKNLYLALCRMSNDLETPKYIKFKNDIDDIDVVVLETDIENEHDKKIKVNMYVQDYVDKGYQQYFPSNLVKYTLHTEIHGLYGQVYYTAYLQDRKYRKIIVGLFKSEDEMKSFVQQYYPENKVSGIFYSDNKYTMNYLRKNNMRE